MKWFKHESTANMDAKLQEILLDYGLEGYGLYWYCIELIAAKVDKDNITFELEHDARIIARNTGTTPAKVEEMMKRFITLGLFENSEGRITCLKLAKKLDESTSKNPQVKAVLSRMDETNLLGDNQEALLNVSGEAPECFGKSPSRLDKNRLDKNNKNTYVETDVSTSGENVDENVVSITNPIPYQKILELYHQTLPELSSVAKLTTARKAQIRQRWKNDLTTLDEWKRFFQIIKQSDFLMGRMPPTPSRPKPFQASLDWIIKESNAIKICEGQYHG